MSRAAYESMRSPPSNNTVLITGASGFVGSHLARRFLADGFLPVCLSRSTSASSRWRLADIADRTRWVEGDLSDKKNLERILAELRPRGILHCAASTIMSGVSERADELFKTNVLGTINLVDAADAIGYDFFIHIGTFLEYGPREKPLVEDAACEPLEAYALSKLAGTLYAQAAGKHRRKPIICARLFTPYGPFVHRGRLVYELITRALDNRPLELTQPDVTRDFIFVDDIAYFCSEAARRAEDLKGEIFNLGTGRGVRLNELVEFVLRSTGSSSPVAWSAFRDVSYDRGLWQADMTKTFSRFSWRPALSWEQGMERTIAWFRQNRSFYEADRT